MPLKHLLKPKSREREMNKRLSSHNRRPIDKLQLRLKLNNKLSLLKRQLLQRRLVNKKPLSSRELKNLDLSKRKLRLRKNSRQLKLLSLRPKEWRRKLKAKRRSELLKLRLMPSALQSQLLKLRKPYSMTREETLLWPSNKNR